LEASLSFFLGNFFSSNVYFCFHLFYFFCYINGINLVIYLLRFCSLFILLILLQLMLSCSHALCKPKPLGRQPIQPQHTQTLGKNQPQQTQILSQKLKTDPYTENQTIPSFHHCCYHSKLKETHFFIKPKAPFGPVSFPADPPLCQATHTQKTKTPAFFIETKHSKPIHSNPYPATHT